MSSQSLPIPVNAIKQNRSKASLHTLPLRAALIAFVAIIILFRWMHLIVSLQVASTDRQIQIDQDRLAEVERANAALLCSIAEASSPRSFAERATDLGYGPQPPAYVLSDRLILSDAEGSSSPPLADRALLGSLMPAAQWIGSDALPGEAQAAP